MSDKRQRIAAALLAAVTVMFVWWGWKQGAYFGSVFYPGAALAFVLLAILLPVAPFSGRLRGPAAIAVLALLGLGAWTLLSATWSPAPAMALRYAWHDFLYLAVFGLGIWATNLLGREMRSALAAVAIAGTVVGIATVVVLATGTDAPWYLHDDATLRFPIGYRNANAAFFMICLWPVLALVVGGWRWQLRALMVAAGTVLVELMVLCQSRGSIPAIAVAAVVYLLLSRNRLRAAIGIGLVLAPAIPALPTLLDVYRHGAADPAVIPLLRDSARMIAVTGALSLLVALVAFGSVEPRLRVTERTAGIVARIAAIAAILAVLAGAAAFVGRHGGPVGFIDQRVNEFSKVGYPDLHSQGVRYGANIGSNRHDFWRVAYDEGLDNPLRGGGGGSFEAAYLENRLSNESPEDPHSAEALMFGELGLPGILLFVAFVVACAMAALRSRRLGPGAAGLVAGAGAGGAQWLMQTSYDWLWNYPGVTAPAMFLLGAAAAPALFDPTGVPRLALRRVAAAVLVVLAVLAVPLFLSARYVQGAYGLLASDPQKAIADLGTASDLNPLDADPLLIRATLENGSGDRAAALADLREAVRREPRNADARYLLAGALAASDPEAARAEATRAHELNPRDRHIEARLRRLEAG